jgi:diguanylate cyclase (GGDEF)-like protein
LSIRATILAGCLALTLLTGALGVYAEISEVRLGGIALDIYDNGFMAMNYLRAAQIEFLSLSERPARAGPAPDLANILGDLDVAIQRAMSPSGGAEVARLRAAIGPALTGRTADPNAVARVQAGFEHAVETFADDGFRYRRQVQTRLARQQRLTSGAIAASLLATILITALLARLIVPPVRRAVRIAQSIAEGRLDNPIATNGRGETADLLRALAVMQASIAGALARIKSLIAEQAATHAGQMAAQNARMSAALENMNQGLCLFDQGGRLAVANRRFNEMFGAPRLGADAADVQQLTGLGVQPPPAGCGRESLSCTLPSGRIIAVSQAPVEGGGWVVTYEDITERQAAQARLDHMARHDVLTALPNRLMFGERANAMLQSPRGEQSVALHYLDIDRFRTVNETLGHAAGDAVLRAVAQRLQACLQGATDRAFRLGGDQFAVLQQCTTPAEARVLAQLIRDSIGEPYDIGGQRVEIVASLGVALAGDASVPRFEALLKCAELALDRAKAEGTGGISFFEADMDRRMRARRSIETDLRRAVSRGEMVVFYQPQIAVAGGVRGFEAVLRWMHPARGMVSPAEFIPVAEEIGLIGALGDWVLHTACREAAGWPSGVRVAVNLSPVQFRGQSIKQDVEAALAASGLAPSRLELEITEAVLLSEDEHVLQTLRAIRGVGARIAMDDFGTGYSSLGYLAKFPFDKIKIDQSFVRGMTTQSDNLAIVRAVIGLGRSLRILVSAEGVETPDQQAMLAAEGADELQGFLFGRPQPAPSIPSTIRRLGLACAEPAAA